MLALLLFLLFLFQAEGQCPSQNACRACIETGCRWSSNRCVASCPPFSPLSRTTCFGSVTQCAASGGGSFQASDSVADARLLPGQVDECIVEACSTEWATCGRDRQCRESDLENFDNDWEQKTPTGGTAYQSLFYCSLELCDVRAVEDNYVDVRCLEDACGPAMDTCGQDYGCYNLLDRVTQSGFQPTTNRDFKQVESCYNNNCGGVSPTTCRASNSCSQCTERGCEWQDNFCSVTCPSARTLCVQGRERCNDGFDSGSIYVDQLPARLQKCVEFDCGPSLETCGRDSTCAAFFGEFRGSYDAGRTPREHPTNTHYTAFYRCAERACGTLDPRESGFASLLPPINDKCVTLYCIDELEDCGQATLCNPFIRSSFTDVIYAGRSPVQNSNTRFNTFLSCAKSFCLTDPNRRLYGVAPGEIGLPGQLMFCVSENCGTELFRCEDDSRCFEEMLDFTSDYDNDIKPRTTGSAVYMTLYTCMQRTCGPLTPIGAEYESEYSSLLPLNVADCGDEYCAAELNICGARTSCREQVILYADEHDRGRTLTGTQISRLSDFQYLFNCLGLRCASTVAPGSSSGGQVTNPLIDELPVELRDCTSARCDRDATECARLAACRDAVLVFRADYNADRVPVAPRSSGEYRNLYDCMERECAIDPDDRGLRARDVDLAAELPARIRFCGADSCSAPLDACANSSPCRSDLGRFAREYNAGSEPGRAGSAAYGVFYGCIERSCEIKPPANTNRYSNDLAVDLQNCAAINCASQLNACGPSASCVNSMQEMTREYNRGVKLSVSNANSFSSLFNCIDRHCGVDPNLNPTSLCRRQNTCGDCLGGSRFIPCFWQNNECSDKCPLSGPADFCYGSFTESEDGRPLFSRSCPGRYAALPKTPGPFDPRASCSAQRTCDNCAASGCKWDPTPGSVSSSLAPRYQGLCKDSCTSRQGCSGHWPWIDSLHPAITLLCPLATVGAPFDEKQRSCLSTYCLEEVAACLADTAECNQLYDYVEIFRYKGPNQVLNNLLQCGACCEQQSCRPCTGAQRVNAILSADDPLLCQERQCPVNSKCDKRFNTCCLDPGKIVSVTIPEFAANPSVVEVTTVQGSDLSVRFEDFFTVPQELRSQVVFAVKGLPAGSGFFVVSGRTLQGKSSAADARASPISVTVTATTENGIRPRAGNPIVTATGTLILAISAPKTVSPTFAPTASPTEATWAPTVGFEPTQATQSPTSLTTSPPPGPNPTSPPRQTQPPVTPTSTTTTRVPPDGSGTVTPRPALTPTQRPPLEPSDPPSAAPTNPVTLPPTPSPTKSPTLAPTRAPTTRAPTRAPTKPPTKAPTQSPTGSPTPPTRAPTKAPTLSPTLAPTPLPTFRPPVPTMRAVHPTPEPLLDSVVELSAKSCTELGWSVGKASLLKTVCANSFVKVTYDIQANNNDNDNKPVPECSGKVVQAQAALLCLELGARLCLAEELEQDVAFGTGCGLDQELVWTSTRCQRGLFFVAPGSSRGFPGECRAGNVLSQTAHVRCCADTLLTVPSVGPVRGEGQVLIRLPGDGFLETDMGARSAKSCAQLGWNIEKPGRSRPLDAVCAHSKNAPGQCSGSLSFLAAEAFCVSQGARLCTALELARDEAKGTGCHLDSKRVWSSTSCSNGQGILSMAGSTSVIHTPHCEQSGGGAVRRQATETQLPVRCCGDAEGRGPVAKSRLSCQQLGWPTGAGSLNVCASGPVQGECPNVVEFLVAIRLCEDAGGRVCTQQELLDDEALGSGCDLDRVRVWTSTPCDEGYVTIGGSLEGASLVHRECTSLATRADPTQRSRHKVRCCADAGDDPVSGAGVGTGAGTGVASGRGGGGKGRPNPSGPDRTGKSVLTCDELGWEDKFGSTKVCASSRVSRGSCTLPLDSTTAVRLCLSIGARLCTAPELVSDEARDSGCGLDDQRVWSATVCQSPSGVAGFVSLSGATNTRIQISPTCSTTNERMPVRCCADV